MRSARQVDDGGIHVRGDVLESACVCPWKRKQSWKSGTQGGGGGVVREVTAQP